MLTIFIVLPCVFLVAGADSLCETLYGCEQPIRAENFFADKNSMIFNIKDSQLLDRICGKRNTYESCFATNVVSCSDEYRRTDASFFKDIIQYICTPAGRTVALATSAATCTVNPGLDFWFITMMSGCVITFHNEVDEATHAQGNYLSQDQKCQLKTKLDTCVKSNMNVKCGPEMATLIEKMWAMWSVYDYKDFSCNAGSVISQRSLDTETPVSRRSGWGRL